MAPGSLRRMLRRRWYFVLAGALVTAGLMFAASAVTPVRYEATGTVLILPPVGDGSGNPYLSLSGYGGFADVLARSMMDTSATQAMRAQGVSDKFTISRDITTSAPIVRVTVSGTDGARTLAETKIIMDSIPDALVAIQQSESVPEQAMFRSKVIAADDAPSAIRKPQIRAVIAAGAFGALLTIWGSVWLDTLLSRRQSRRAGSRRADRRASSADERPAADQDLPERRRAARRRSRGGDRRASRAGSPERRRANRRRSSDEEPQSPESGAPGEAAADYLTTVTSPDDISSLALMDDHIDFVPSSEGPGSRHGASRRG